MNVFPNEAVVLKKGGKFIKELWCCISGRIQQGNLVLSTELIT